MSPSSWFAALGMKWSEARSLCDFPLELLADVTATRTWGKRSVIPQEVSNVFGSRPSTLLAPLRSLEPRSSPALVALGRGLAMHRNNKFKNAAAASSPIFKAKWGHRTLNMHWTEFRPRGSHSVPEDLCLSKGTAPCVSTFFWNRL